MEVFATVEDLRADGRAPDVSDEEAEVLLTRASAYLSALMSRHGVEVDPNDEVQATNLKAVCCNMVRRACSSGSVEGLSSFSQAIGSTNVSVSYRDPDGSFYLSRSDKELLGIFRRGGVMQLRTAIKNPDGTPVEGW